MSNDPLGVARMRMAIAVYAHDQFSTEQRDAALLAIDQALKASI